MKNVIQNIDMYFSVSMMHIYWIPALDINAQYFKQRENKNKFSNGVNYAQRNQYKIVCKKNW